MVESQQRLRDDEDGTRFVHGSPVGRTEAVLRFRPLFSSRISILLKMFRRVVQAQRTKINTAIAAKNKDAVLLTHWEAVFHPEKLTKRSRCVGDERRDMYLYLLDNLGYIRNEDQVEFHRHLFYACIDKFYGSQWPAVSDRVMKEFGLKEIRRFVCMLARRRLGKTIAVCLHETALMITCPGESGAVLSTNMRIATLILDACVKMLQLRPELNGQYKRTMDKLQFSHVPISQDLFDVDFLNDDTGNNQGHGINGKNMNISEIICYPGNRSIGMSKTQHCTSFTLTIIYHR